MIISGQATPEGTRHYAGGHGIREHFRKAGALSIGSIGIGTYLGEPDDRTDRLVAAAVVAAVRSGANLIDTASNYRLGRAERSIAEALRRLIESGEARREELVLCTKGGFLPAAEDSSRWFEREYLDRFAHMSANDLVAGCHCMHPDYLRDQIDSSLKNLGVETLDVYYLHNPETQLRTVGASEFSRRLRAAFEALEEACTEGKVACWGLATWNALRTPPGQPDFINLAQAKALAQEVAVGDEDHLRFIQLPINLAMPEALLATQQVDNEIVPVLEAARRLKIQVISSASIGQGQLIGKLPGRLAAALGPDLGDAQRALQFTRSTPGLTTALVGMKTQAHVRENLALARVPPLRPETYLSALQSGGA